MSYAAALDKSWEGLESLKAGDTFLVKFLADEYTVDCRARSVLSLPCNTRAKDFTAILILHYLVVKIGGLPALTGEWCSFKDLAAGEQYYPAFRKRAIEPIIRKYGNNPEGIFSVLERLPAVKAGGADAAIVLDVFEGVPAKIQLWRGDDEFAAEANMFFDKSIPGVFCTEDVAVLGGFIAASI
jgi:hypothetical protein